MTSDYIKELEVQNEELKQSLAQAQQQALRAPHWIDTHKPKSDIISAYMVHGKAFGWVYYHHPQYQAYSGTIGDNHTWVNTEQQARDMVEKAFDDMLVAVDDGVRLM
jgi:hypothetical protein